jgi:hypothetical protein
MKWIVFCALTPVLASAETGRVVEKPAQTAAQADAPYKPEIVDGAKAAAMAHCAGLLWKYHEELATRQQSVHAGATAIVLRTVAANSIGNQARAIFDKVVAGDEGEVPDSATCRALSVEALAIARRDGTLEAIDPSMER